MCLMPWPVQQGRANGRAKHMAIKDNSGKQDPDWALGLKQLYNSVLDEPLPDAFKDLLSKLDEKDPG